VNERGATHQRPIKNTATMKASNLQSWVVPRPAQDLDDFNGCRARTCPQWSGSNDDSFLCLAADLLVNRGEKVILKAIDHKARILEALRSESSPRIPIP